MSMPWVDFFYAGRYYGKRHVLEHQHPGLELVLTVSGECTHIADGEEISATPGTLLILPPETLHSQLSRGLVETWYTVAFVNKEAFSDRLRCIDVGGDHLISRWMQDLTALWVSREQEQGSSLLQAILIRLQNIERQSNDECRMHPALAAAVNLLHNRFATPLTVNNIASECGISTSYLNALFNAEFDCGPLRYLQQVRMDQARQLLRNPYLSVAEVGYRCGYEHSYYFCRIFRKTHKCTPGEYRQQHYGI